MYSESVGAWNFEILVEDSDTGRFEFDCRSDRMIIFVSILICEKLITGRQEVLLYEGCEEEAERSRYIAPYLYEQMLMKENIFFKSNKYKIATS